MNDSVKNNTEVAKISIFLICLFIKEGNNLFQKANIILRNHITLNSDYTD